jgi:hypothetical protein
MKKTRKASVRPVLRNVLREATFSDKIDNLPNSK